MCCCQLPERKECILNYMSGMCDTGTMLCMSISQLECIHMVCTDAMNYPNVVCNGFVRDYNEF